jgi:hypothetical protein
VGHFVSRASRITVFCAHCHDCLSDAPAVHSEEMEIEDSELHGAIMTDQGLPGDAPACSELGGRKRPRGVDTDADLGGLKSLHQKAGGGSCCIS